MLTKAEEKRFYSTNPKTQHRATLGGKSVKLVNFPKEEKEFVRKRLAEKDEVMALGRKGILPGLKIDGKQVTRENIHEFEIPAMRTKKPKEEAKPEEKPEEVKEEPEGNKLTRKVLETMTFSELRDIGYNMDVKGRGKSELIKEILEAQ